MTVSMQKLLVEERHWAQHHSDTDASLRREYISIGALLTPEQTMGRDRLQPALLPDPNRVKIWKQTDTEDYCGSILKLEQNACRNVT